jgi:serine phosphatase RsbU (regulator of sigma subunit)/ligand-binding sensor domain-containing protein
MNNSFINILVYPFVKMQKHILLISVLFFLTTSFSIAQPLPVEKLNTTHGLSNNKVYHIFQDSYGFIWIGTEYGLNLYDGCEFKIFKNEPGNPESINSNVIWWIIEDKEKNLWISTGVGVSKYLRAENKFKNYDLGSGASYFSSIATYIDLKRNIWATVEGENILKYNKADDTWDEQKFVVDSNKTYNSPAHVTKVIEDKNGKMWIASIRYGLMWYDENESVFKQSEIIHDDKIDDFTIIENFITDLYSDSSGVLWITSRKGIYKYDPAQKLFRTIQTYDWEGLNLDDDYNSIIQDRQGNIWITNNFNGLLKFDGISDIFKRIELSGQSYSSDGKSNLVLSRSLWDRSGNLWIGTMRKGLFKYDPNKKNFSHYTHDKNNNKSISSSYIFSLLESKVYPGNIYVGTAGGSLNLFDTKTNTFSTIPIKFIDDIYGGSVRSILEEEDGSLWLGTWGDGLLKMNPKRKVVRRFYPDSTDNNSISNDRVRVIRKDLSGNLWIGTNGGLNYFDQKTNTFSRLSKEYSIYPQKLIDLIKNKISQNLDEAKIIEVENLQNLSAEFEIKHPGNYLVVTAGEGGYGDTDLYDYGWIEDSRQNIIWSPINSDSTLYIGGHYKNRVKIANLQLDPGKYLLKYKSDDSHCYGNWNENPPVVPEFWGIRIFEIDNHNELESIQKYLIDMKTKLIIEGSNINDILISKNNIVWVGTREHGLYKIAKNKNNVTKYFSDDTSKNEVRKIRINDIFEDNEKRLWLATNHGLIEFDPIKESFNTFTENDGLSANFVYSILPGDKGNLWLSTNNGLSKMIRNTTEKPTFVNYGSEDGVGGLEFTNLVALKTSNGKYYFGGERGLIEFSSDISICPPPQLILSNLKISNKSVFSMGENSPLESSLYDLTNLSLSYLQNDLTFESSVLHYCDPKKNKYAHKLEGYEEDWVYDDRRIATYTNLDPGKYTFKFKGSNRDGIWNEPGKAISIIITPPWWQTWWAYSLYVLCFIGILSWLRRFELHRRKEKEDRRILELENERKTKELEEARVLQLSMLPKEIPQLPNLDISAYMKTATEVGGDYYDFFVDEDETLTVIIGDATGHGMNAGMMVSITKGLFQNLAGLPDLKQIIHQFNKSLYLMGLLPMMMSVLLFRIKGKKLEIINSGMPDLLIYRDKNNFVDEMKSSGPPLGAYVDYTYEKYSTEIDTRDVILSMSDGFVERFNEHDEMIGYDKCKDIFKEVVNGNSCEIIDCLNKKSDDWAGSREQDDDIAFVVLKHK